MGKQAADQGGHVQHRVLGLLAQVNHLRVLLVARSLLQLVVLRPEGLVPGPLLQHLRVALGQRPEGIVGILGCQLVDGPAKVHGASVGLPVQLQDGTPQGGLAAAGLTHQAQGFALVDVQGDAVVGPDEPPLAHGKILLEVCDLQQQLLLIILHDGPPSPDRSTGSPDPRPPSQDPGPHRRTSGCSTCSGARTCSPWAGSGDGAPRRE